jgi:L-alanine-DL-glutamate epimerase-like enolase superfamily enzyme
MQITCLETVRFEPSSDLTDTERDIELTMLRVHTDERVVGLGETYPLGAVESAALLGPIADRVLGRDPRRVEAIRTDLVTDLNYYSHTGAESRAMSALDIALWDVKGRLHDQPIYQLLGGAARDEIPTYNTSYDATYDVATEPVALAESLLEQGITSMKIWPFDGLAGRTGGQRISSADLERGLEPLRRITEAVGDEVDVAVEFHGLWGLTAGKKLVAAVEPYDPLWVEDVIRKGSFDAYRRLAAATDVPLCVSERLMGRYEFKRAMDTGAVDVAMPDVCWTGGLTEGRAIAALAESYHLPVAPHNCGGPVLHAATAHLCATIPNLYLMETVRDRYDGWHQNLVTEPLVVEDGSLPLPPGPGLGTRLEPSLLDRDDTIVERAEL